jgi:hypothetical protein
MQQNTSCYAKREFNNKAKAKAAPSAGHEGACGEQGRYN